MTTAIKEVPDHYTHPYSAAATPVTLQLRQLATPVDCGLSRNPVAYLVTPSSSHHFLDMASRRFTLPMALSMLDIPLPEEDDMSDDEFDG